MDHEYDANELLTEDDDEASEVSGDNDHNLSEDKVCYQSDSLINSQIIVN
ncbi:hypothetical protein RhiirC2_799077 [Rhizophagus irregularis]|uniref:Uncharacterized protein n=1 Tax=Rhizophagus irregularis TaxID=588596 RepID=A0A2N1M5I7_9GLOM|nr:hypothetical protein RhiirC2_799077 [Rhizophagus irregularis]